MDAAQIIYKYFSALSEAQKKQIEQLGELYAEWNTKINVISRKDMEHFYERHVLHSLGIAKIISFQSGTKIMDVGTGGGIPGIPLAILFPECKFHLVDSIGKKIKVVNAVAESLGLKNVTGIWSRAEQIEDKFHFIVSRAVTELSEFLKWTNGKFLKENDNELKNGILYLRGDGNLGYKTYELRNYFTEEFFETKKVVYIPSSN